MLIFAVYGVCICGVAEVGSDTERKCLTFQLFVCVFLISLEAGWENIFAPVVFQKMHHSNVSLNQLLIEKNGLTIMFWHFCLY